MGLIEIFSDDSGAGNRRPAFRYQHRRGARGVQCKKCLATFPGALVHQPRIEAVFAQREADEARMRTERMMKQREHEPLDRFRMIKKFSTVLRRAYTPQQRSKLPKHANEATCVLPLF